MHKDLRLLVLLLVAATFSVGCKSVYYGTMEKLGWHKRDILVDRVEAARDSQEEAKEQFQTALERFSEVLNYQGGALEAKYKQLKAELDRSESRASDVSKRINAVTSVAEALFAEWQSELEEYSSDRLRRKSEDQLRTTRQRYEQLIGAMRRAESKIEPVLRPLRDQVLFIKHNLNAQAISSLQSELATIEDDVASLIKDMEASIAEANEFIESMGGE